MSNATAQNIMPVYAPNPSPRVAQATLVAEREAQAQIAQRALQSAPMLDPRLTATPQSFPPVQINGTQRATPPPQNGSQSQANTPTSAGRPASPQDTPKMNGTTQAQSIPSISILVHATDSVSVMSDNKSNSSRAGSKSPKENSEQRPKDIPHEKLNILGEDQRAIRVLDRKFMI
jgi:hypothetical protein